VLKHVKSNGILISKNNTTVGLGAGQVSRVDAVYMALKKGGNNLRGAVLASDAFFPFRDSIDALKDSGISTVIQPGGSIRDDEVVQACNDGGISMLFTGTRCFKH
jgi:phosphoribosylaminoimidazolecarboxamide formyltransferase/IMP cyclohydrolase